MMMTYRAKQAKARKERQNAKNVVPPQISLFNVLEFES